MANSVNPVKGRQLLDYEISGTYLRKQGGRQQYFYYARLTPIKGGFAWDARILSDEELKGTPSGQVMTETLSHAKYSIVSLVELSIENLVEVRE